MGIPRVDAQYAPPDPVVGGSIPLRAPAAGRKILLPLRPVTTHPFTPFSDDCIRSQIVTASHRNTSTPPFAFTEQGVAMLSGLLKSDIAIAANIAIMRAFVQVREYLLAASSVSAEIKELRAKVDLLALQQEENLGAVNDLSEDVREDIDNLYLALAELAARIEEKRTSPRPKIGFVQ